MSTLTELVKSRRDSGQGVFDSLSESLRDRIRERFDPRRILNQSGLLVALFPKLKAFTAKPVSTRIDASKVSPETNLNNVILQKISEDVTITAKNSMVLPAMHRDFNVMRQNIAKLVKLEGVTPRVKADMWFKKSKVREDEYENKLKTKTVKVEKESGEITKKISPLMKLLTLGAAGLGLSMLSGNASASINRQPGTGGTSGGLSFNQLTKEEQDRLLEAQFVQEGKNKPGSLVNRLNNPGAMKFSKWQEQFGATKDESGFAKFPSLEEGKAAQRRLWEKSYGNMPIEQAVTKWAPDAQPSYTQSLYSAVGRPTSEGKVTSDFGMRIHPITGQYKMHEGIDIAAAQGTPVKSTKEGKVTQVGFQGGYGNFVEVDHGGGYKTRYAHLSATSVSVGQPVSSNQEVGKVGSTGRSTGPHLHYELLKDGRKINPNSPDFTKLSPISPALAVAQSKAPALGQVSADVARLEQMKTKDKEILVKQNTLINDAGGTGNVQNNRNEEQTSKFIFDRLV